jgi:polyphosphate glucokinase
MTTPKGIKILSIDIGGSHIKSTILDKNGELLFEYEIVETPKPATPASVMEAIKTLVKDFPPFDKISAGFPGYIKQGVVITAPNLEDRSWHSFKLAAELSKELGKPTRVVNDADMQGLGVVSGKGLEIMITLGTGFGTAFLKDGNLLPHFELAHHPIAGKRTYDDYLGARAIEKAGKKKWNKRLRKVFRILKKVFNYDSLYVGGGNAAHIRFKLDQNITLVTNKEGIHGGARLWLQNEKDHTGSLE